MTTLARYDHADQILRKLSAVRARRWTLGMLTGVVATGTFLLAVALAVSLAAGYWRPAPPPWLRWALLAAGAGTLLTAAAWFLLRAALWRENPAQTARYVEQALPELDNDLINAVLLSRDGGQASPALVQKAIDESAARAGRVDLSESISMRRLRRWGIALAATAVLTAAFAIAQPGPFGRGLWAVLAPNARLGGPGAAADAEDDAALGDTELLTVTPRGGSVVYAGEPVTVVAEIRNTGLPLAAERTAGESPARRQEALAAYVARLDAAVLTPDGDAPRPMQAEAVNAAAGQIRFTHELTRRADKPLRFAVRAGGRRWPESPEEFFAVSVVRIERLDLALEHPAYTALPPAEVEGIERMGAPVEVPLGTKATVRLRLSAPAPGAVLRVEGLPPADMDAEAGGRVLTAKIDVAGDVRFRLDVPDEAGRVRLSSPPGAGAFHEIRAIPDRPPEVKFVSPNRDVWVAPGHALATRIRVSDDYGLTAVALYAAKEGDAPAEVHAFAAPAERAAQLDHELKLPPDAKQGDVVVYFATATDNRRLPGVGGPQTAETSRFKIFVRDAEKLAEEKARRYEQLRRRLLEILRMQEQQRVNTDLCRQVHETLERVTAGGGEIAAGQAAIKQALATLAFKFPFDDDMITVQQALAVLANNEAQLAIDQARAVAELAALAERGEACRLLAGTQDRVIDTLQTLLAIMPSLANRQVRTDRPGGDLPAEARKKLEDLRKALEDFIEEQRKVIEASQRLAKRPVDDFTAEDEKLLEDLQAVQDKWEKFLNEAMTDFSKLTQQDFSNPSLLKELISVKTDVTMAKDALSKKATEIATAIEDNGIENAKSLTANIEKWLPDEPDRTKWSMEDPAGGQENVEAAELPTELEDLVGDLLEEEEDLFDEMDDVTSKYAGSFDKGVGWDASDGPISSMNAQGVTGNQLPNTNEMSGRSGEGRQGKSSGEFVEDKAVGKGGRRTPTRLTPEPFQQGQVDDQSTDPAGGATGGGKLSGAGEEGLEGPVPAPLQKELQRLAGKQASLINRAERIRERFQVNDYSGFRFLQAITLMNRVRSDLEQYRYRNALRARDETVGVIRETRLLLSGEVDVTADTSQSMPKYIRDDIADAMKGDLPEKFRDALQDYYRRLSEQAGR